MQRAGMPLLVHGEVTDAEIDLFDREKAFIDTKLIPLRRDFPALKIVFEHITTREAAQYVSEADAKVGATVTAHHLLLQPQRAVPRRRAAALLLPAGPQARGTPACAGGRRDLGQRQVLPRHRQRAACDPPERARRRLCRLLHRPLGARALRRSLRRRRCDRSTRSVRELQRPRPSTACRATPPASPCGCQPWVLPESLPFGETTLKPLCGGETLGWQLLDATS